MTISPVRRDLARDVPDSAELLIKEAQFASRRRRLRNAAIVCVSFVVAAALIIVASGRGSPPKAARTHPHSVSHPGATGSHNAATPGVLGGQSVQSVWPAGGETTWVFTMNVTSPTNGAEGVEWTDNGGRTWRDATPAGYNVPGGRFSLGSFFALSATRAWVVAGWTTNANQSRARLLTTENGGRTWTSSGTVPTTPCTLVFSSASDGVCTSAYGAGGSAPLLLYATHDGGATWVKAFDNTVAFAGGGGSGGGLPFECDKELSLTAGDVVWAKFACDASTAVLFRSSDSGRKWSQVSLTQPSPVLPGGSEFTGPVVIAGGQGAVAFTEGRFSLVYVTHDGGASFTPVYPPGPRHAWAVDVMSPTTWRLAFGSQIIGTNDAGASWFGLSVTANALPAIRNAELYGIAALHFSTPTFGWLSYFTGNGYLVTETRNGGRSWRPVVVPGTGRQRN